MAVYFGETDWEQFKVLFEQMQKVAEDNEAIAPLVADALEIIQTQENKNVLGDFQGAKLAAAAALQNAISSLSKSSLDLEDTFKNVMDYAKELTSADRSTLWLINKERNELWTKIPINGRLTEIRIPRTAGFSGMVAQSGEPLLVPFDLYDDERSPKSKEIDKKASYRTCSLLCLPVFDGDRELIGVILLVNKTKSGEFPDYDPAGWPAPPEKWKASFTPEDLELMEAFNIQVGVALQNAKLFDAVKQERQRQRDILRNLTHGVISTDRQGNIIAANEKARDLLGVSDTEILEGKPVKDSIGIKEGDFAGWLDDAIRPVEAKDRQQYYPNLTLIPAANREAQSINLYVSSMADVLEPTKVNGALVVMEEIDGEKQVKNLMYRYMTPEVAESLLASGDTGLGGKRKQVSILFCNIRNYTTWTQKLTAEEVVATLNSYFEEMVDAVLKYGGTLDKYIGDTVMAVFGSPAPLKDHPWCAMQAAVEMRQRLTALNEGRVEEEKMPISISIGIHSDEVVSGSIGSSKRMELTSIDYGVNLASRLEGLCKQYGTDIVISESAYRLYKDRLWVRELDAIAVRGMCEPMRIYELVGIRRGPLRQRLTKKQQEIIERYHKGREYYLRPQEANLSADSMRECFELAEREFREVLKIDPNNKAAKFHIDRCQLFQVEPPSYGWNGAWRLTERF